MRHPYDHLREKNPGKKRAHEMSKHFKRGGKVAVKGHYDKGKWETAAEERAEHEHKATGGAVTPRLDKRARGGGTKKHSKGHHTHVNIVVAPKGGDASGPDLGAGAPPPAAPMVPKAPMAPPMGALGAGPPSVPPGAGGPKPPGMMKRGGKTYSGIASKANIEHWAKRTGSNTRYAEGGAIAPLTPPHMKGGAGGAEGRLDKKKAYGIRAHMKDGG